MPIFEEDHDELCKKKNSVAVYLDGVLASYIEWRGIDEIGDPYPGSKDFMDDLYTFFDSIIIITPRISPANMNDGETSQSLRHRVQAWLDRNDIPYDFVWDRSGIPLASFYIGPNFYNLPINQNINDLDINDDVTQNFIKAMFDRCIQYFEENNIAMEE